MDCATMSHETPAMPATRLPDACQIPREELLRRLLSATLARWQADHDGAAEVREGAAAPCPAVQASVNALVVEVLRAEQPAEAAAYVLAALPANLEFAFELIFGPQAAWALHSCGGDHISNE